MMTGRQKLFPEFGTTDGKIIALLKLYIKLRARMENNVQKYFLLDALDKIAVLTRYKT